MAYTRMKIFAAEFKNIEVCVPMGHIYKKPTASCEAAPLWTK